MRDSDSRIKTRICMLALVALLGCLIEPSSTSAVTSPLEVIRSTTNQARAVLSNANSQDATPHQRQFEQMWEIVLPHFNTEEVARRSLGIHWQKLTAEQRQEFTRLFVQLVKKNYTGTLKRYTTDAQFFFDKERIEGEHAEVQTRITTPAQEKSFSVVYRLHRQAETWLIYDVVAENVSLVQNYRNQFSRIIAKSSVEGLFATLKQKLEELSTT